MEDLGVKTPWGTVEPFSSNEIPACLRCCNAITPENNSRWEMCVELGGSVTQPICIPCWNKENPENQL